MKSSYRRGNKLVVGSTQSGKSYAEVHDVLAAADGRNSADGRKISIIVEDPHKNSLARRSLEQLIARGHKGRVLWDQLDEPERGLKYRFILRSRATNPVHRAHENRQQAEHFAELLCRRR